MNSKCKDCKTYLKPDDMTLKSSGMPYLTCLRCRNTAKSKYRNNKSQEPPNVSKEFVLNQLKLSEAYSNIVNNNLITSYDNFDDPKEAKVFNKTVKEPPHTKIIDGEEFVLTEKRINKQIYNMTFKNKVKYESLDDMPDENEVIPNSCYKYIYTAKVPYEKPEKEDDDNTVI
jgi:hypothetical protein